MSARTQQLPVIRKQKPSPHAHAASGPAVAAPPRPAPDQTQEIPAVRDTPPHDHGPAWQSEPDRPPEKKIVRLFRKLTTSPAWVAPAALAGCFAGAAGLVLATDPTDNVGGTTCAFKLVTGFDCPGCGGTRAFYYVLTMNLPEAARHHAIALFAAPILVLVYLAWAQRRVFPNFRWKLPKFRITPALAVNFLIAWGAFWVIRNLPWEPFTVLYV